MVPSIAFEARFSSSSASLINEVVVLAPPVAALLAPPVQARSCDGACRSVGAACKATRGRVSRKERSMFLDSLRRRRFNVDVLQPCNWPLELVLG